MLTRCKKWKEIELLLEYNHPDVTNIYTEANILSVQEATTHALFIHGKAEKMKLVHPRTAKIHWEAAQMAHDPN